MNRSTLQVAVVALLAAAAIVAAAGSVDDLQTAGSGEPGPAGKERTETETTTQPTTTSAGVTQERRQVSQNDRTCETAGVDPLLGVGIVAVLAALVAYVYARYGKMEAIALTIILVVLAFLAISLLSVCQQPGEGVPENRSGDVPEDRNRTQNGSPGGGGGGSEDGPTAPDLPLALVAIVAVLAAAAAGAVLVTREDDDEDPFAAIEEGDGDLEGDDAVDVDEFAAAAGRAADRIEDADDVDNEIYRAWVEMTRYLDVDHPESSTPGEFAAAAVAAGIDRDDVVELTDLFERVRYGHTAATEEREERALDALRRIEAQYGDETTHETADRDATRETVDRDATRETVDRESVNRDDADDERGDAA